MVVVEQVMHCRTTMMTKRKNMVNILLVLDSLEGDRWTDGHNDNEDFIIDRRL